MTQRILTLSDKIQRELNIPQVLNVVEQLPHHATKKWTKRDFKLLQGIVVHHFASEAPLVNQAKYHINYHGWPGIAYAIVIRDNQILQTNYLDDRTYHASGGNDISIGVVIGGDLSKRQMTDFERRALTGVLLGLKEMFPNLWVKGHNQITPTSCPCTDMNRIRADLHDMEETLSFQVDTTALAADSYKLAVRMKDLQSKFKHVRWGGESKRKASLLKGVVPGTAEEIVSTVLSLYKAANDAQFIGDDADKLRVIVEEAKKVRLI